MLSIFLLQLAVSGRTTFLQLMVWFSSLTFLIENGLPSPKSNYMLVGHFLHAYIIYEVGIVRLDTSCEIVLVELINN